MMFMSDGHRRLILAAMAAVLVLIGVLLVSLS